MKCPKCGYNSFETSNNCRRCSTDLSAFRDAHGLSPIVLPAAVRSSMASQLASTVTEEHPVHEAGGDMFTFDLPQHDEPSAPAAPSNPFAFAAPNVGNASTGPVAAQDPFADLLETTPVAQKSAEPAVAPESDGQGFELNSFSWDDTPEPPAAGADPQPVAPKKVDDDFSSLFGELGSPDQKP